jgi:hypothetical protein
VTELSELAKRQVEDALVKTRWRQVNALELDLIDESILN